VAAIKDDLFPDVGGTDEIRPSGIPAQRVVIGLYVDLFVRFHTPIQALPVMAGRPEFIISVGMSGGVPSPDECSGISGLYSALPPTSGRSHREEPQLLRLLHNASDHSTEMHSSVTLPATSKRTLPEGS
jgi:hypothetical protein